MRDGWRCSLSRMNVGPRLSIFANCAVSMKLCDLSLTWLVFLGMTIRASHRDAATRSLDFGSQTSCRSTESVLLPLPILRVLRLSLDLGERSPASHRPPRRRLHSHRIDNSLTALQSVAMNWLLPLQNPLHSNAAIPSVTTPYANQPSASPLITSVSSLRLPLPR